MGRPGTLRIRERLGLPLNPQASDDPAVRRAYTREVKRIARARKLAEKNRNARRCQRGIGHYVCGGLLEEIADRITGKLSTFCPLCDRRARGICRDCPRRIVGDPTRAVRCAECRDRSIEARRLARYAWDGDRIRKKNAATNRRRRRNQKKRKAA